MIIDRDSVQEYIYLRGDGAIVVDSRLLKTSITTTERELLLSLVEDHVEDHTDGEQIRWREVWQDFQSAERAAKKE